LPNQTGVEVAADATGRGLSSGKIIICGT